jgi:hypothetical protein
MNCKNCDAIVDTKFCPNCGQSTHIHNITVKHVLHDVLHAFTHADKGFLLLAKKLLLQPGIVAREYIDGKRKTYFNPLSFLVITSAIYGYFAYKTGYMQSGTGGGQVSASAAEWSASREVFSLVGRNVGKVLSIALIVPLYSFLTWLFFIGKKRNYAEHFILNSFIFGEAAIYRILVIIPLFAVIPHNAGRITYFIYEIPFLIYTIVAFRQFFQQHIALVILKGVLIRVLFVALFFGLIFAYVYAKHYLMG